MTPGVEIGAARAKSAMTPPGLSPQEFNAGLTGASSMAGSVNNSGINMNDLISAFVLQNYLPPAAEVTLRDLPQEIALPVMQAGPLEGDDRTGALVQRVQDVVMDAVAQQQATGHSQSQQPVQPLSAHAQMPVMALPAQSVGGDALSEFCMRNGVDNQMEHVLRSAPVELQMRVMAEGPLLGGNPSQVLIHRVKRMMGQGTVI